MTVPVVKLAAEGVVDIAVCRRLLRAVGMEPGDEYGLRGKDHLDRRLAGYNAAAAFGPWIVARDLDSDAQCAAELAGRLLPNPAQYMRLRIVVRSVEAWLLSDPERFSIEFSVPKLVFQGDQKSWISRKPRCSRSCQMRGRERFVQRWCLFGRASPKELAPSTTCVWGPSLRRVGGQM